jgi:2-haloacid dehalogenase
VGAADRAADLGDAVAVDAVIFDIGGVVIPWVPQRAFEQVMAADEVPGFMERIDFAGWNRANDGRANIEAAEDDLVRRFPDDEVGIRAYRQHFLRTITSMVPGTPAIIAELGRSGVIVSALTNWSADLFAIARKEFGILSRFRDIVVSGKEGIVKPDPAIYQLACERLGITAERAVFVDDTPANAVAASRAGLTGLTFTSAGKLREDLVRLGLLGRPEPVTEPVFHWAPRTDWASAIATGDYPWSGRGIGYLSAGFVHFSFARQLAGTRAKFYADLADEDLVLLRLDPDPSLPIVVESGFPHLFAPLPVSRVQASAPE